MEGKVAMALHLPPHRRRVGAGGVNHPIQGDVWAIKG
jgi:hypothetical protein